MHLKQTLHFCKFLSLTVVIHFYGGVQLCRSTTVPKNAGKFQNNLHAFSKEREITDANYQRKSLQFWRQYVCICKLNNNFDAKTCKLQILSRKIFKFYSRL